jgi:DNA-directed RNA polymerase subunit RPC12/RpoP
MDDSDDLPLTCPKCRASTRKPVRWVQEHTFYVCAGCGASVLIDKDAAMKLLAELHHDSL